MPSRKPKVETKTPKDGEQLRLKVVIDYSSDMPSYYANFAEISRTEHEFAVTFAKTPPKPSVAQLTEAKASGELVVEPIVQILFPPTMMEGLITALRTQFEKFQEGKQRDEAGSANE
ncbi:MAG: hypothetical protein KIT81_06920 [Alphaproteobacteria bacterium]|nr:hypothetical protein [Alphaproteobacteria bacterium]